MAFGNSKCHWTILLSWGEPQKCLAGPIRHSRKAALMICEKSPAWLAYQHILNKTMPTSRQCCTARRSQGTVLQTLTHVHKHAYTQTHTHKKGSIPFIRKECSCELKHMSGGNPCGDTNWMKSENMNKACHHKKYCQKLHKMHQKCSKNKYTV